jgi:hypothetical protein
LFGNIAQKVMYRNAEGLKKADDWKWPKQMREIDWIISKPVQKQYNYPNETSMS